MSVTPTLQQRTIPCGGGYARHAETVKSFTGGTAHDITAWTLRHGRGGWLCSNDRERGTIDCRVADIAAVHAALKARGAREERPPGLTARMPDHELWTSFFRDSDNNLFALMCEKRTSA